EPGALAELDRDRQVPGERFVEVAYGRRFEREGRRELEERRGELPSLADRFQDREEAGELLVRAHKAQVVGDRLRELRREPEPRGGPLDPRGRNGGRREAIERRIHLHDRE